MNPDVKVPVMIEAEWVKEQADGTACVTCGDGMWLNQFRLTVRATTFEGTQQARTKFVRCQSCHEANQ